MRHHHLAVAGLVAALLVVVPLTVPAHAGAATGIFVELADPAPVGVAQWEAAQAGETFDAAAHRAAIRAAQDAFLQSLAGAGIAYTLTSTGVDTPAGAIQLENRYTELINAIHLQVGGADVIRVRRMPSVRHVSLDTPRFIALDKSVAYIRANGPGGTRASGYRGTGTPNPDGSASGQVIAYMDTGVDHTHPMFDTTVDDSQFQDRLGDTRLPRLGGEAYVPGEHHPKVIYRADFSGQPVLGDDNGHGTQGASTAAGLKVQTPTGEILEGVAPGALIMDYKVCPSLTCDGNLILQSLEDSVKPFDIAGNPKPVATVVNLSLGSCDGDPYSADAIAAGNLQFFGAIAMAAAGNLDLLRETLCDDHVENTLDSPGSGRLVMSIGASLDPGNAANNVEVLQFNQSVHDLPGPVLDPGAFPGEPGQPLLQAIHASESAPIVTPIVQHYVDVKFADSPDDFPLTTAGRICLSERGSDIDAGAAGTGLFGHKAAECAAHGGIALIVFNNQPGPIGSVLAPSAIPVVTLSREDGLFLRDSLGFESSDPAALSRFPVRINLENPAAFTPDTAGFSARGPNNDFLVVKPDLLAPGVDILMAAALASGEPTRYTTASGTSFATPHAAGTAALIRDPDVGRPDFVAPMVRAALMNSATNLRLGDGATPVADDDDRNFLHETGAGLAEMVRATGLGTFMGTNELNGTSGPDDVTHPDFLPSYSFGELAMIGTGRLASDPSQQRTITVTMADVGGGGGTFDLGIVDAAALRGNITRPLNVQGFSVSLGQSAVTLPAGGTATFDVSVAVDGTSGGLQIAGADEDGLEGTDIAWFVTASRAGEDLRMPFYVRAVRGTGNQPPVTRSDSAVTTEDQPVDIAVLANDSDPEGDPLGLDSVSQPANGTATANADGTVTYDPDPGFLGTDTFTYTVSDGANTATGNVTVRVFQCTPTASGSFTDDFEPDAEAGWTVDTPVNESPTSVTWSVVADPLAHSLTNAFFSDAASPIGTGGTGLIPTGRKDDRLTAPPVDLTPSSQLIFWHRFSFEPDFDGGMLEVSTDGGSTWVDVVAGGGAFVEGGYNGILGNGRPGWTGDSTFLNAMNRVVVDLGAYAGLDVKVRWRLFQDANTGALGWWVDDVEFTGLLADPGSCNLPPEAGDDHAVTQRDTPVTIDVLANDTDPEGDDLSVTGVTQPANGTATINPDDTVTYTPNAGYTGDDAFSYTVSDGELEDEGTVTVEVLAPRSPGKTTGGGWIPDQGGLPTGNGKANFGFNARRAGAEAWGHLTYHASNSGISLEGDVNEASVNDFDAEFSGSCTLSDGSSCTFFVEVQDAAEPGKGADRFRIRVTGPGGGVIHEADALLGGGNVQVKPGS